MPACPDGHHQSYVWLLQRVSSLDGLHSSYAWFPQSVSFLDLHRANLAFRLRRKFLSQVGRADLTLLLLMQSDPPRQDMRVGAVKITMDHPMLRLGKHKLTWGEIVVDITTFLSKG
jgi:hypothetical protein